MRWVIDTNVLVDNLDEFRSRAAKREAAGEEVLVPAHVCAELARILRARTSRGPFVKPFEDIAEAIGLHRIASFTLDDARALVAWSERHFPSAEAFGAFKLRLAVDASHAVLRDAIARAGHDQLTTSQRWSSIVQFARGALTGPAPTTGGKRAPTQVDWLTIGMAAARQATIVTDEKQREFGVGDPPVTWSEWTGAST